ncbi:hypothetical protein HDU96_008348 [Phlyctochytrium bullatum]|nr:hypothetical protein HDU96_008348 [Phlyctochytrium bullatum]
MLQTSPLARAALQMLMQSSNPFGDYASNSNLVGSNTHSTFNHTTCHFDPASFPAASAHKTSAGSFSVFSTLTGFLQNEIFGAGVGLMLFSTLYSSLASRLKSQENLFMEQRSVTVMSDNEAYTYVTDYIHDHPELLSDSYDTLDHALKALAASLRWCLFVTGLSTLLGLPAPHRRKSPTTRRGVTLKSTVCISQYEDTRGLECEQDDNERPVLRFLPDDGGYSFRFARRLIDIVAYEKESAKVTGVRGRQSRYDDAPEFSGKKRCLRLSCRGEDGAEVIEAFLEAARDAFWKKTCGMVSTYTMRSAWNTDWRKACMRPARPLDSIVLREGLMETIVKDVRSFLGSEAWYAEQGVPYRRGYLLHGPPGTGKTSTIFGIASEFSLGVFLVSLNIEGLNDAGLFGLLASVPKRAIIVFEDIDSAFPTPKPGKDRPADDSDSDSDDDDDAAADGSADPSNTISTSQVTLSGLLNAIDGIAAQEGRLVFMTTNHPDRLPRSLLRPGRCDRKFLLDHADASMVRRLFRRFFASCTDEHGEAISAAEAERYAAEVAERLPSDVAFTTAQLQGLFLRYREQGARAVVEGLEAFVEEVVEERREMEEARRRTEARKARKEKRRREKKRKEREEKERAEAAEAAEKEKKKPATEEEQKAEE